MVDETPGVGQTPGRGSRLDDGTKLVLEWRGRVFPQVGEAVAVLRTNASPEKKGTGCTPEENLRRAARRARTQVRRYCVANRLRRLITLTYRPPFCTSHDQVVKDVGLFIRHLRKSLGIEGRFAYVWVPELHKDGQRYHVHVVVDRFIPKRMVEEAWGHGFVDVREIRNQGKAGNKGEAMRRVAGYVAKYVGKSYDDQGAGGRHRYEVGQGCQPISLELTAPRTDVFRGLAALSFGGLAPSATWSSGSQEWWTGPPVEVWQWELAEEGGDSDGTTRAASQGFQESRS